MALDDTGYDAAAQILGLDQEDDDAPDSNYWGHLDGNDLGTAVVDRFRRFREWMSANGLLKKYRLQLAYYHNEYRADPEIPHCAIMQQFGSQGEYQYVSLNHLRSILKTVQASVVQNPPNFQCRASNADADSLESASLYQGVLDYYSRDLGLPRKINKCVELALVVDAGYALVEWDPMAVDGDAPTDSGIWAGAPSVKVLTPWDVCFDVTKSSWGDLDWIIVRDWSDKEKLKAQFPEMADEIDSCATRSQVVQGHGEYEPNRFSLQSFTDMSNDCQLFKLYYRPTAWMPNGRFAMFLESGKVLMESPVGLVYPKLPVVRFVCDECPDLLLGYSPINEMLGCQEAVNSLVSAITTNANNYANQYVAAQIGTDLNPRLLATGQALLEFPAGAPPPQGLNLTAVPESLFQHLKDLLGYMEVLPGVSNPSRGQSGGANQTGSAMLFLAGQTTQNQGSMSDNYSQFSAAVMTALLHVLRTFARTQKTVRLMGRNVASREIVLAHALADFDEVVVDLTNPMASSPAGKMAMAQQLLQYGNISPQDFLTVVTSGNLSAATDPAQETKYLLELENEWLMDGSQVLVNALDNHQEHIMTHTRLLATPWLRKPELAQQLGMQNAPTIMQNVMNHIQQHMGFLAGDAGNQQATNAGAQPGEPPGPNHPALGHSPPGPQPSPAAPPNANVQAQAGQDNTHLPSQPRQPQARGAPQ